MIFLIFFLLFNVNPVYADDYDISKDTTTNLFYNTIGYTIGELPAQEVITYDESLVKGELTQSAINTHSISTLTTFASKRRYAEKVDRVYGPPGARVDILYFYSNESVHDVKIDSIAVPISRTGGDLSRILDIQGELVVKEIPLLIYGNNLSRESKFKYYNGINNVLVGDKRGVVIDSWYIKNPLEVKSDAQIDGELVKMSVTISNNSSELLNNISFKHYTYEETFDLPIDTKKNIVYELQYTGQEILESFEIGNPNIKTECAIQGGGYYKWYTTNAITVVSQRNEGWIAGAYVQPEVESFCVQRIPYTMYSDKISLPKQLVIEDEEKDIPEVSGVTDKIDTLPQTGKDGYRIYLLVFFLVMDTILWYSFLRRIMYEYKGKNSRLCTKSSKNVR